MSFHTQNQQQRHFLSPHTLLPVTSSELRIISSNVSSRSLCWGGCCRRAQGSVWQRDTTTTTIKQGGPTGSCHFTVATDTCCPFTTGWWQQRNSEMASRCMRVVYDKSEQGMRDYWCLFSSSVSCICCSSKQFHMKACACPCDKRFCVSFMLLSCQM